MATMEAEVLAGLIGGVGGLVGALLGGAATVWTARHQGRVAVQTTPRCAAGP